MEIARLVIIAVIVLFGIPLAAVVGGVLLAMLKTLKSGQSRAERDHQAEETGLIQEIHDGLVRMEERVEALETLLLDRDGGNEASGNRAGGNKASGIKASGIKANEKVEREGD